ncbi:SBBP repeat-containing protein [Hymenobacter cellulosivorans]|uniref:SBBP repeat-containing protein n=1 Tax=Hymenobacter cellulosivorans TaxID=2932249 RepID=A0ABY4FBL1_9BACT|nr:SBBP repeat-containing protein [Hymenobacter cellulosivorans]UOQ53566.1 SBBP repeat-containing protein [Hymenobacter cellulosivorans]
MKHSLLFVFLLFTWFGTTRTAQAQLPMQPVAFSSGGYDNVISATYDAQGRLYLIGHMGFNQNTASPTPPAIRTASGNTTLDNGFNSGTYFIAVYGPTGQLEKMHPYYMGYGGTLRSIAVDQAGNIYLTGTESQYTFMVRKINRTFQTLWTLTQGTNGGAWGNKVLVDAQGNVYVAGTSQSWSMFGLTMRQRSCCLENDFLIKVNAQGTLQWIRAGLGGPNDLITDSSANSIAFDRAGNVVMVGTLSGTGTYGNLTLSGGSGNIIAVKYNPTGNVLWGRVYGNATYPSRGSTQAMDVATDEADNLYICGNFYGPQQFGTVTLNTASYYRDALLLKLNSEGTPLWARAGGYTAGTNLSASAYASVAYRDGKIKVAGYSQSTPGLYESNPVVASYEANGRFAWATNLRPGTVATGNKILIDENQTSHVFGFFKNTFQIGATAFPSYGGQQDAFYVQVLDSARYGASCLIRGTLYQDANRDCRLGSGELGLGGIIVEALPGPRYGITDSLGRYLIATDTGRYTVRALLPQRPGQQITPLCPASGVSDTLYFPTPGASSQAWILDMSSTLPRT